MVDQVIEGGLWGALLKLELVGFGVGLSLGMLLGWHLVHQFVTTILA